MSHSPFVSTYSQYAVSSIQGRYLPFETLKKHTAHYNTTLVGESVLGNAIEMIQLGNGKNKILMWSQMHGNESTTTKAVLDMLSCLTNHDASGVILESCSLYIIPMLNPDGANAYTRLNSNEIDLNRDAISLSQPESRVLRKVFDQVKPDYCFNLHDQRTIFGVGDSGKSATVSFLAPAADKETSITPSRKVAMGLISEMNKVLQTLIPDQVGRFDDTFNANCVGDTFQSLGTPTILFESGHFPGDYQREKTRELVCISLLTALTSIASSFVISEDSYMEIPENRQNFVDLKVSNVPIKTGNVIKNETIAIQYQETLVNNTVKWVPKYHDKGELSALFAHHTLDFSELENLEEPYLIYNTNVPAHDCFNFNILS